MITVAIVGLAIGVGVEIERNRRWAPTAALYRGRAEAAERRRLVALERIDQNRAQIAENEKQIRINKDYPASVASIERFTSLCRERIDAEGRMAEHSARMKAKYLDAARRPWLPVAPDLPEPE
jgi:hypothetical protein